MRMQAIALTGFDGSNTKSVRIKKNFDRSLCSLEEGKREKEKRDT
jgi:hypothetical protein